MNYSSLLRSIPLYVSMTASLRMYLAQENAMERELAYVHNEELR